MAGARAGPSRLAGQAARSLGSAAPAKKSNLEKGMATLLNRSAMKGIVDPAERSHALGADVVKKMGAMSMAMGTDPVSAIKMLGSKV